MTSKFDRLERFFSSRRRTSPAVVECINQTAPMPEPQFPSPSFLRPKTSRMTARDEVRFRQVNERSPSVPDINSARLGSTDSRVPALSLANHARRFPGLPPSHERCLEPLVMELNEFQFPAPPSRNGEVTPKSMTFECSSSDYTQPPSPRSRSPIRADKNLSSKLGSHRALPRIRIPTNPLPTPRESFQMGFDLDSPLSPSTDPLTDTNLELTLFDDFQDQLDDAFGQFAANASCRNSSRTSSPSCRLTYCSTTLREPDFNDFLNLSDDDIAESTPETPDTPDMPCVPFKQYTPDSLDTPTSLRFPYRDGSRPLLPAMDLSISSLQPSDPRLLTLTPPRASRPAEAGALMAARIAKRFDFDLIYVVNLWPGNRTCQVFDSDISHRPLVGRLLAAHGLQHVPSPLQISSDVHASILAASGWIEYRNKGARPDELSHGYARGFYTGKYARNSSEQFGSCASSPISPVENIDRGIVFAAYRKPRRSDPKLTQGFTEDQLACLHDEAETLVNVLLDIHAQNRGRQNSTGRRLSDETGPMPFF